MDLYDQRKLKEARKETIAWGLYALGLVFFMIAAAAIQGPIAAFLVAGGGLLLSALMIAISI